MNWLKIALWALVIFLVVWLVVWLIAQLLVATTWEGTVGVGQFLDRVDWVVGALAAATYVLINVCGKLGL